LEPWHRPRNSFDRTVVLRDDVVEVLCLSQSDAGLHVAVVVIDRRAVGSAFVDGDVLRPCARVDGRYRKNNWPIFYVSNYSATGSGVRISITLRSTRRRISRHDICVPSVATRIGSSVASHLRPRIAARNLSMLAVGREAVSRQKILGVEVGNFVRGLVDG
jgi:hypothetical protein